MKMQATTSHPQNEQKPPPTTPKTKFGREKKDSNHLKIWPLNHKFEHKPPAIHNIWALNHKSDQTTQKKAKKTHKPILKTQKPTKPNRNFRKSRRSELKKGWDERSPPPFVAVASGDVWNLKELGHGDEGSHHRDGGDKRSWRQR